MFNTATATGLEMGNRLLEEPQQVAVGLGRAGQHYGGCLDRPMSRAVVVDPLPQARERAPGPHSTGAHCPHVKMTSGCAMHPGKPQTGADS